MGDHITTGPLDGDSLGEICKGLEKFPYLPYTSYREVTPASSVALVRSEIDGVLGGGGFCLVGEKGGRAVGLVTGQELDWDSNQLGVTAGRLGHVLLWERGETPRELVRAGVAECRRRGIVHLSCRVPSADLPAIHSLEGEGFRLMESLLTFGFRHGRDRARIDSFGSVVEPCDGTEEEIRWVGDLAATSFHQDRFHVDPHVSRERADALHRAWMENSCRGFADIVLIARDPGTGARLGFLACKKQGTTTRFLPLTFANMVLGAVAPEARRRGAFSDLTLEAMTWARRIADVLEVGTQYTNTKASGLYIRAGFQYIRSDVSLRLWMPETQG